MAKKSTRIKVGLVCTESKVQNYVIEYNKLDTEFIKKEFWRYSPPLRKHTKHIVKKKLD